MATVTLHFWAGARAAAGTEYEVVEAPSVAAAVQQLLARREDPRLAAVLAASSLMIDGSVLHAGDQGRALEAAVEVDVLPPFAGGR